MAWTTNTDGWMSRKRRDGGTDYRILMRDMGRTNFAGASKRYAEVWHSADGSVLARSQYGYVRRFDSVDEAKKYVGPAEKSVDV